MTIVAAVFAAGCGGLTLPDAPPSIEGTIVSVEEIPVFTGSTALVEMHVKEVPPESDPCGIIFRIDEDATVAVRLPDGTAAHGSVALLDEGLAVRVWADGGIAESCPAQAATAAVEIMEGG